MNMCPTNKCKSTPESCLKGQVFFIWTSCSSLETLKDRISLLGGKVEQFLSKDVTTVLLEDNQLVGIELGPDLQLKPSYGLNGTVVASFPYTGTLSNIPSTSSSYNLIATNTSTKFCTPYRIICYARQWGIQIVGIGQFLTWTEPQIKYVIRQKQRKASEIVTVLNGYYIKFESIHKNHRPCYKMFNNDADHLLPIKNAKVLVKPENCIVMLNKPVGSKQFQFSHMDTSTRLLHQGKGANLPVKGNEKKPLKLRPKEENNYCECCKVHFVDFKQHIRSTKHQNFVSNEKNYESVHSILKMLPTPQEFIENLQNPSPTSDPALTNGDTSRMSAANIPETDFSVPLNLQVRKQDVAETVMPINMHVGKDILPQSLQLIKNEVMPLPLDLHVKRNDEIKTEDKCDGVKTEIKQETNLLATFEQAELLKKEEPAVLQPKIETNEDSLVNVVDESHCDEVNGGDFLDKDSTAALAQMCLKNFDSYWLDTLPCEVDDMVFDDIFDFDDGKTKPDNEVLEPFAENVANSELAQSPGLVSGISTPNLKTQNTENTSVLMSTSMDVKDFIKTEPPNPQSFPPTCKLEKENESEIVSQTTTPPFNESPLGEKKQIFSIVSFCSDKIGVEASPSCSTTLPPKDPEPLFSSESSDEDENGNVLISNALNFIANSDLGIRRDRESSDENSLQEMLEVKDLPEEKTSNKSKNDKSDRKFAAVMKNSSGASRTAVPVCKTSPSTQNQAVDKKKHTGISQNNSVVNKLIEDKSNHSSDAFFAAAKHPVIDNGSNPVVGKEDVGMKASFENTSDVSVKSVPPVMKNTSVHKDSSDSLPSVAASSNSKSKVDLGNCKDTTSPDKPKEWDYTSGKIFKKYTPMNRNFGNTTITKDKTPSKKSDGEAPTSVVQRKLSEEKITKSCNEKYPNPKKNISLRETAGLYNRSEVSIRENVATCPDNAVHTLQLGKEQIGKECNKATNISDNSITPVNASPYSGHYESPYGSIPPIKNLQKENRSVSQIDLGAHERSNVLANQVSFTNTINEDDWKEVTSRKNIQSQKESFLSAKYVANKKTHLNTSKNSVLSNSRVNATVSEAINSVKNAHPQVAEANKISNLDFPDKVFIKGNQSLSNSVVNQSSYESDTNLHLEKGKSFKEKLPKAKLDPAHFNEIAAPVDLVSSQNANRAAYEKKIHAPTDNTYSSSVLKNPVPCEKIDKDPTLVINTHSGSEKLHASKKHNLATSAVANASVNIDAAHEIPCETAFNLTINKAVAAPLNYVQGNIQRDSELKVNPTISSSNTVAGKVAHTVCDKANQSTREPSASLKHSHPPMAHKDVETKTNMNASSADIVSEKLCTVTNQNKAKHSGNVASNLSKSSTMQEGKPSKDSKHKPDLKVVLNTSGTNVNPSNLGPGENRITNQFSVINKHSHSKTESLTKSSKKNKESVKYKTASHSNNNSVNAVSVEKKTYHISYEHFNPGKRKKTPTKERRVHKKRKQDPVVVNRYSVSETNVRKEVKKLSVKNSSTNPCQYSYRTAKYNIDSSSSSVQKQTSKIPHKKESSKIDSASLWTVSVSGVKLKFTRIHPKKVDTYQYVTEDESD